MRVAIVGAGITGLSLLHHLRERGVDAVCYEAAPEPGGVIESSVVDGRVVERGPQRLRLTDGVRQLVRAVDLEDELLVADDSLPLYVYAGGSLRRVPRSIRGFLRTDLLSWRGKLRVLAEPLTAPGRPDESAAELFARKFGGEAYRRLVGPLFGGMYASEPERMPARHALESVLRIESESGSLLRAALSRLGGERPPPASFRDGLQALPLALAAEHADRVELGTPVERLRDRFDGYLVGSADGDRPADRVVITTPAPAAADLLEEVAPEAARALRDLTYNPLALVHLHADADADGFGYQVAREANLHTLGVTWNASLFDRAGVFTAFLGGMGDRAVLDRDDGALGELAATEFETVMDEPARPMAVSRLPLGFPAYDGSWDALEGLDLPDGVLLATNYTARMGIPARIREARTVAERMAAAEP